MTSHKRIKSHPWPCTLVTGASSGLGWALALQLARAGTEVIALGRSQDKLQELVRLAGPDARVRPWPADLSDTEALSDLACSLAKAHPDLACVIHNAGVQFECDLDSPGYGHEAVVQELAINLTAPIVLTQALLPHLRARPDACVANISSGLAYAPKRGAAVYAASKAGLSMFSRALRLQLEDSTVRVVNVVLPLVDTPMTSGRAPASLATCLPAHVAAQAVIQGIASGHNTVHVGAARALPWLAQLAPGLLAALMAR